MPFGLTGSPATFQHLIIRVLHGILWKYVLCYIDDVVIFSSTFEEHLQHIKEVFTRMRKAGLKLLPNKCFSPKRNFIT